VSCSLPRSMFLMLASHNPVSSSRVIPFRLEVVFYCTIMFAGTA